MRKKIMSALACCLLIAMMLFALIGCAKDDTMYTLDEAYRLDLISKVDLESIAYFFNEDDKDTDTTPRLKSPATLSKKTNKAITRDFKKFINKIQSRNAEDVQISGYFGTYNGYVAITIYESGIPAVESDHVIDGVVFYDYNGMYIWDQNN